MKKSILTLILFFIAFIQSFAQITYENGLPTGMTITNPSNSSNSYYTVSLNDNLSRAAGGLSIGLDSDLSQRFWLFHVYKDNNALVRKFHVSYPATGNLLTIQHDGKVGIGTTSPDSKLTVAGNIHSREVKVAVSAGADFVFENSYPLRSLEATEAFIKENQHLPEIASESEMLKEGLELGTMNIKLLQKIEELTLYMIDVNKRVKLIEQENSELKESNQELQNEILALKKE